MVTSKPPWIVNLLDTLAQGIVNTIYETIEKLYGRLLRAENDSRSYEARLSELHHLEEQECAKGTQNSGLYIAYHTLEAQYEALRQRFNELENKYSELQEELKARS